MHLKIDKKNLELKIIIIISFFKFLIFISSTFKSVKSPASGKETSGYWTVRILKICRTSGPDVMSCRALPYHIGIQSYLELPCLEKLGNMSLKFNFLKKLFEACLMVANDYLQGKTTHFTGSYTHTISGSKILSIIYFYRVNKG